MTLPGGSNPADVLFKLAKGRGLASPTFEQVTLLYVLRWLIDYYDTSPGISSLKWMYFMLIQIHEGGPPHARTFTWICKWLEVINITSLLKMYSSLHCFKFSRIRHCGVRFKVIYRDSSLLKDVVEARKRQKMHQRRYSSLTHHFSIYHIWSWREI